MPACRGLGRRAREGGCHDPAEEGHASERGWIKEVSGSLQAELTSRWWGEQRGRIMDDLSPTYAKTDAVP